MPKARKESAKEKQLKEEEKILESVAEGRGTNKMFFLKQGITKVRTVVKLNCLSSVSSDVRERNGQRYHL